MSLFDTLNKLPGECQWITKKGLKPCNMPEPVEENGQLVVKLQPGAKLYHATILLPRDEAWYSASLAESEQDRMWFASTPEHAMQINWTHILEYTVMEEIALQFIQNLKTHAGVIDGKKYTHSRKYKQNRKDSTLDGYAGCNECEFMLLRDAFRKLSAASVLQQKNISYLEGGGKRRRRSKTRKVRRRRYSY